MSRAPYRALTLAIHPNSRGFGWIALSGPFSPYDWGTVGVRGRDKNVRCLRHIEKLLDQLTPETVVLEAFDARNSKRRTRIANLGHAIVALAQGRIIDVAVYTFKDVQGVFADLGARSRYEIAEAVVRTLSLLSPYLPKRRKAWHSEGWRLSLFCAAALALTHYQRDSRKFLDSISQDEVLSNPGQGGSSAPCVIS